MLYYIYIKQLSPLICKFFTLFTFSLIWSHLPNGRYASMQVKSRMMGDSAYKSTLDCFFKTLKNDVRTILVIYSKNISDCWWGLLLVLIFISFLWFDLLTLLPHVFYNKKFLLWVWIGLGVRSDKFHLWTLCS